MYAAYFNLASPPFAVTPDPRYVYLSENHREALAHLQFGIQQPGGFVQLTGEVGTGKTTLCRCLLEQLPPQADVAVILNPRLGVVGLLATICEDLGVAYPSESLDTIKTLVDALYGYLLNAHARGRRTVVIIDEAQDLSPEVLEQVRLLTNLETSTEKLLQIILIGQPELTQLLARRELRQLAQRITARYHLTPLSRAETVSYLRHRLRVAGGEEGLFTAAAERQVYRFSGGIPRLINVLCDRALLGTYALERRRVDGDMVRRAGREIRGEIAQASRSPRLGWTAGLGVAALALTGAMGGTLLYQGILHWSIPWPEPAGVHGAGTPAVEEMRLAGASRRLIHGSVETPVRSEAPSIPQPRLAEVLAGPGGQDDDHAAFSRLLSLWGVAYRRSASGLGCDAAKAQGFECVFRVGSWNRLRRYDLPCLLELSLPGGGRRHVALVGLRDESAVMAVGGRLQEFPLIEIDRYWDGGFILLWKPPPFDARLLAPGMRGEAVQWLRKTLDAADGVSGAAARSDLFDADLTRRIMAFQRSRSLNPDGRIGLETLTQLMRAVREPGTPSLSAHSSQ
jgi:general secretion pathway protein A